MPLLMQRGLYEQWLRGQERQLMCDASSTHAAACSVTHLFVVVTHLAPPLPPVACQESKLLCSTCHNLN